MSHKHVSLELVVGWCGNCPVIKCTGFCEPFNSAKSSCSLTERDSSILISFQTGPVSGLLGVELPPDVQQL